MMFRLFDAKPLFEPMWTYFEIDLKDGNAVIFERIFVKEWFIISGVIENWRI